MVVMLQQDEGSVLLIDKPLHWTSFDVVKKIKWTYKLKKVGHAGTLDPLASGLLIICTGKKTKQIESFMGQEKEYTGTMVIGKTTPSVDLETPFDSEKTWDHITRDKCREATKHFIGEIKQVPPIFSAVRIQGKRAYMHARKGEKATIPPRFIRIDEFELTKLDLPEIEFRVICSKGTYIRSLVQDFGNKLGTGAYLSSLRRTKIGNYSVDDAMTIDQIVNYENLS